MKKKAILYHSTIKKRGMILKTIALGMVFLLCACSAPAAAAPAPVLPPPAPSALPQDDALGYRFLCALPHMDSQTMTEIARGVQDRCDELGIEVLMHNAHSDHMSQAVEIDAFVENGGQAILCQPVDFAALQPFLQLARQQGVFVVNTPETLAPNTITTADTRTWADAAIDTDSYAAGRLLGENAAAFAQNLALQQNPTQTPAPEAPAAVLLLEGARTPFAQGVEEAYSAAFPGAQTPVSTHIIPESADLLVENLLAENPDIRVFLAGSDAAALAARQGVLRVLAAQQQAADGIEGEEAPETPLAPPDLSAYYFGGMGATREGQAALQTGQLSASVSQNGYAMGLMAVDAAVALLQGRAVENRAPQPILIDKTTAAGYNE